MIVQPYIEHSENGCPTSYRILTLFGNVLYSTCNAWDTSGPRLEAIASDPEGIIASNSTKRGRVRQLCNDPEIIALGERAHLAFPECPVLGVDVLRDATTGKLYVMEVNPRGPWHSSFRFGKTTFTEEYRRKLRTQFNALDRVARLLTEKTRAEAT